MKTEKIFSIVIGAILVGIGFFSGSVYELDKQKIKLDQEISSDQQELEKIKATTDWNALKNIEVNSIVQSCMRCKPMVHDAFERLDKRKKK